MIAKNVSIFPGSHRFDDISNPMNKQGFTEGKVVIEDDVWIGCNAVINPNILIKSGTIVGANAVVTKTFPKYSVIGGVPAKLLYSRK
jgi:maltose O-acetyltransferase